MDDTGPARSGFGESLAVVGDCDEDGVPEIVVAAPGRSRWVQRDGAGALYLLSGANGKILRRIAVPDDWRVIGQQLISVPDIDGDRRPDILFSARDFSLPGGPEGRGVVAIAGSREWAVSEFFHDGSGSPRFGRFLGITEDVDDDGAPEVLVGDIEWDGTRERNLGRALLVSLSTRSCLGVWSGGSDLDSIGGWAARVGDLDGDGIADLAVTGFSEAAAGEATGWRFGVILGESAKAAWTRAIEQAGALSESRLAVVEDLDGDDIKDLIVCATKGPDVGRGISLVSGRTGAALEFDWSPARQEGYETVRCIDLGGTPALALIRRVDSDRPNRHELIIARPPSLSGRATADEFRAVRLPPDSNGASCVVVSRGEPTQDYLVVVGDPLHRRPDGLAVGRVRCVSLMQEWEGWEVLGQ